MTTRGNIVANADVMDRPLPDGWEWARLEDVCEPIDSVNPRQHPDTSFKYVDISSIDRDRKEIVHPKETIGRDAPSRARQEIEQGDVLVSTTRPNLNAVAQVPYDLGGEVCSTGFCVLRPGPLVLSDWVFQYVRLREFVTELDQLATGSSYPAVTDKQVKSRQLPVPPLPQQHRIVRALQERMEAIESAKRAAEAQLDAANAMSAAYLRQLFPAEGEELPEGWEWVRLGDVCSQDRKAVSPSDPLVKEIPYLSMGDVESGSGRITTRYGELVRRDIRSTAFAFTKEHVIFGKLNPHLHKFVAPPFSGRCTTEFVPLSPKGVSRDFLCLLIRRPETVEWSVAGATGSTLPRVRMDHLLRMPVPLPPDVERIRLVASYSDRLEHVDQMTRFANAQLETSEAMTEAYLRSAFDGNLG